MQFVRPSKYPQLAAVRFCLGVAESGFYPGVAYYLTMWYPKYMLQRRFAIFLGAAASSGAFSGLLAYGINFMNGVGGLQGWSWIFIIEGLATILVGVIGMLFMVDYPATAGFLTTEEKEYIMQQCEYFHGNQTGDIRMQVQAAFMDWQVCVKYLCMVSHIFYQPSSTSMPGVPVAVQDLLISTSFGYSVSTTQLLSVPPYALGVVVLGIFAYYSDKKKLRSPFLFAAQVIALVGYIINICDVPYEVKYFGTYWIANNLEGKYKRAVGMALVLTMGNFGGAIGSNIFRTQDAPRYLLGYGLEIMFIGISMIAIPIVALTYRHLNFLKDVLDRQMEEAGEVGQDNSMFKEKRSLRYTL
ncbi:hypothetical protein ID866_7176 [Astraeus odoratus]|nr:hypothetical protein ID866_7176 [Astraeus odoratus]